MMAMMLSPVVVDRLIIGVSETYDVIVTIPAEKIAPMNFWQHPKTELNRHLFT